MHWQFGEMKFGEMKRNTSNWSNFGMLLRRAGLTASAGLSCCVLFCLQVSLMSYCEGWRGIFVDVMNILIRCKLRCTVDCIV